MSNDQTITATFTTPSTRWRKATRRLGELKERIIY